MSTQRPSVRRAIGSLCLALADLALTVAVAHAQTTPRSGKPHVDSAAVRLLNLATQTLAHAHTLQGTITTTHTLKGSPAGLASSLTVVAQRPGMLRLVPENNGGGSGMSGNSLAGAMVRVELVGGGYAMIGNVGDVPLSSGAAGLTSRIGGLRIYTPEDNHSYRVIGDTAYIVDSTDFRRDIELEGLSAFFGVSGSRPGDWTSDRLSDPLLQSLTMQPNETVKNVVYNVVKWTYTLPNDTVTYTTRLYIGPNHLIARAVTSGPNGDQTDRQFHFYLDEEIPENSFVLPPKIGRVIVPKT